MGNQSQKEAASVNKGGGGQQIGSPVVVNVYNLQRQKNGVKEESVNGLFGFGVYHSGLEVFGKEWSFGGNPNAEVGQCGIFATTPKTVLPKSQFFESVTLGVLPSQISESDIFRVVSSMKDDWTALSYHLLSHNCNHFVHAFRDAICSVLHVKLQEVPSYVNRAARVADFFVPEALYRNLMGSVPQSNGNGGAATPSPQSCSPSHDNEDATANSSIPTDRTELEKKNIRQLKTLMWVNGVSMTGCIEKKDLIDKLLEYNAAKRR